MQVGRTWEIKGDTVREIKPDGVFKILAKAEVKYRSQELAEYFVSMQSNSVVNFIHRLVSNVGMVAIYLVLRKKGYKYLVDARRACGDFHPVDCVVTNRLESK